MTRTWSLKKNIRQTKKQKQNKTKQNGATNQFLSVNIGVIRLLSVITTNPFGNYGTSETLFDQKRWKKIKNIGKILPILSFTEQ
jgi:hypothetical protein